MFCRARSSMDSAVSPGRAAASPKWRRREIAFPSTIPWHRRPAFGRCGLPPREASRRRSHSGSPGTDHRSSALNMVCSPHCEFERVRHHAKHAGSSFRSKVRAKNVKALQPEVQDAERDLRFREGSQRFPQTRLHDRVVGDAGDLIHAAGGLPAILAPFVVFRLVVIFVALKHTNIWTRARPAPALSRRARVHGVPAWDADSLRSGWGARLRSLAPTGHSEPQASQGF